MGRLQLPTAAWIELSPFSLTFVQTKVQKMQPNPTIKEISNLVAQLSEADQAALLKALKAQLLLLQARHLDESVKPNQVEMDKIVEVVRKVRQIRSDAAA